VLTVKRLGCRIAGKPDKALRLLRIDGRIVDQDIRGSGSGDRDIRKSGKGKEWSLVGWASAHAVFSRVCNLFAHAVSRRVGFSPPLQLVCTRRITDIRFTIYAIRDTTYASRDTKYEPRRLCNLFAHAVFGRVGFSPPLQLDFDLTGILGVGIVCVEIIMDKMGGWA
jgi:hypothetical protein